MTVRRRIAIVGGGIAGLTTALRIADAGGDVTVFEREARAGGVLESSRAAGYLREHAANGFLSNAADGALPLCRELGVAVVEAAAAAKRRWIYVDGRLQELPGSPMELASTELLSWRGKLRALAEPLARPAPNADESVASFFRRRLGSEVVRTVVEPFVTGIYAGDPDHLSIRAAFPRLVALEKEGGLAVGMAAQLLGKLRRGGDSPAPRTRLWAPEHGMEALTDALAARLGDRLQRSRAVVSIDGRPGHVTLRFADGEAREFDRAVLALPAPVAARLVSDASPPLAALLDQFTYARVAVVHLGFARSSVEHPLDGFGFLVARGEAPGILGCLFESTVWPGRADANHVLLRCMLGGAHDPNALDLTDPELVARAKTAVADTVGARGEPAHVHVVRWPRAVAQYMLGHLDRVAEADSLAAPLGILLAGASYRGVSINDCVASARRTANDALA